MNQEQQSLVARLPEALLPWYKKNARALPWRKTTDPYLVWLSEIMLQQTRVEAVKQYYRRFLSALPTIKDLAAVSDEQLFKLWEGLGYYTRATNLKKAAQVICQQFGGVFPHHYDDILSLPGIGEYTAGAVASICFGQPTPAVDGNVLRVVTRVTELFSSIHLPAVKREIAQALSACYPAGRCGEFTQSLMELGATVCVPNGAPNCAACPANAFCKALQNGTQDALPVRPLKKARRKETHTVFVLSCGRHIAVRQRPNSGLLAGMWEFPNVPGELTKEEALPVLKNWGLLPLDIVQSVKRKHIFTHVEWHMQCYYFTVQNQNEAFRWVLPEELRAQVALPTAFRMFCDCL